MNKNLLRHDAAACENQNLQRMPKHDSRNTYFSANNRLEIQFPSRLNGYHNGLEFFSRNNNTQCTQFPSSLGHLMQFSYSHTKYHA